MDAKITKDRLGNFLSYEWLKIIATAVMVVILLNVLFATVATRTTAGQHFTLVVYKDVNMPVMAADDLEDKMSSGSIFSYDVLSVQVSQIANDYFSNLQLQARFSAGDIDATILTDMTFYEDGCLDSCPHGKEVSSQSNLHKFVNGYLAACAQIDEYMNSCEEYLNTFYAGAFRTNELDRAAVEAYFRTERMVGDKRYKNEKSVLAGIEAEAGRIEKLKADYLQFEKNIEEGLVGIKTVPITKYDEKHQEYTEDLPYAIDLSGLSKIKEIMSVAYKVGDEVHTDETTGLSLVLHPWADLQKDLQFEQIAFVNYLVQKYNTVV